MKIKNLEWDSCFFQKKIGLIEVGEEIKAFSDIDRFELLYVKQREDKNIEIENFNQTYIETKVIFSKKISRNNICPNTFIFSAVNAIIEKEQIYKLALESGKFSRFKLDENFGEHEFEVLYKTWVDNSFNKEFADAILVYKGNNIIRGFITYKIVPGYASVGLLAVSNEYQGKGIGRKLLEAVEYELSNKQIKELRIPTQLQNEQACRFYKNIGYRIIEKTIIKHYWKL